MWNESRIKLSNPSRLRRKARTAVTARTVAVRQGEKINKRALKAMFKQIIANNRAGGWRKLKRES